MGANEGAPPVPVAGEAGYFTQKEAAVVSALMDYLGIDRIGVGDALSLLGLARRIRVMYGAGEARRHEGG